MARSNFYIHSIGSGNAIVTRGIASKRAVGGLWAEGPNKTLEKALGYAHSVGLVVVNEESMKAALGVDTDRDWDDAVEQGYRP